ncbi:MAG: GDP-mannose 4,6-dehydratase, partial [Candidatus Fervidibacter sp.]|uniref:GDP-mannose 4,6-dehydratase n=1 Tax=Candidatus Fervidibacter sp. TaxID=3100871 RepID=UPI00404A342D
MRVLITGITGFVGSHLAELALGKGAEVFGTYRWRSRLDNIQHLLTEIRLIECDLRDAISVRNAVKEAKPSWIFHLAAQSFVPASWTAPADTMHINVIGTINLFEAVRQLDLDCRILNVGSSEEYGLQFEHELPIKETNPLRPLSPYAVSKVAQDLLGWHNHRSYKIFIIRTRAFNHSGPRRPEAFVDSGFAWQIARIEAGLQEPIIHVGNLDAKRDFTDVRDIVRAYWLALEKGEPGEVYNICSGKAWSIREVLEMLLNMANTKVEIRQDQSRMRPSDVPVLVGDSTKFR